MDKQKTRDTIRRAIRAHAHVKLKVLCAARTGALPARFRTVATGSGDGPCEVGLVLRRLEPALTRDPDYHEIRRLLAGFHKYAEGLARAIAAGDTEDLAFEICEGGGLDQRSRAVATRLAAWRIKLEYGI